MKKYLKNISKLSEEYYFDKNQSIDFNLLTHGSNKKVWWRCSRGHSCTATICDRTLKKRGCPYCSNQRVCKDNCLATTHPDIVKEWSDKNNLNPNEVTAGSGREIWWNCKEGHSFKIGVCHKVKGYPCPCCSGKKAHEQNCLSYTHSELSKEWSPKNAISPNEVTYGSKKVVLWKCKKCKKEWSTRICHRTNGHGCPMCKESKGEKLVAQFLDESQVRYKREYIFDGLPRKRFDFALFSKYARKPYAVIEYHGEQHYKLVNFSRNKEKNINKLNRTKKNDKIKKDYCLKNDIAYLEISYKDSNNIWARIEGAVANK